MVLFWLLIKILISGKRDITSLTDFFKKKKDFIYLFLQRGEGREKEREKNIDVWRIHPSVASRTSTTGDLAHNPGMYPDWESNWRPFGSQASTQSTEPHQPGQISYLIEQIISDSI